MLVHFFHRTASVVAAGNDAVVLLMSIDATIVVVVGAAAAAIVLAAVVVADGTGLFAVAFGRSTCFVSGRSIVTTVHVLSACTTLLPRMVHVFKTRR